MKTIIVLCSILIFGTSYANCTRYDGYKLYRATFREGQQDLLNIIVQSVEEAEFWLLSTVNGFADIFVPPNRQEQLIKLLINNGFSVSLLNDNVQSLIDAV